MVSSTPYGSWSSPVSAQLLTRSAVGLSAPAWDGSDLYWLEARPDQGGRVSLWHRPDSGALVELTPEPFNVRTRVYEYGGGEFAVDAGLVVFSHFADGRLYRLGPARDPEPITPAGADLRFGDLRLHAGLGIILAVREDHRSDGEAVTTIVELSLDTENPDGGRVICSGADFYADPELGGDGRLAWTQWDHPAMPWDAATVHVGRLTPNGVQDPVTVAGGPTESALHPRWLPGGRLMLTSDRTGFWNLYAWSGDAPEPVCRRDADFDLPLWRLGQQPYAVLDAGRLVCTVTEQSRSWVGLLDLNTGQLGRLTADGDTAGAVAVGAGLVAGVLTSAASPARVAVLDPDLGPGSGQGDWQTIRAAGDAPLEPDRVSLARAVSWSSDLGEVYGWYYPPTSPETTGPAEDRPPMIVYSHGGPTGMTTSDFRVGYQYWTSRGIAVLDVNYGGSAGFGRAYRERLRGRWGLVDVADCVAGALALADRGLADRDRLVISGGSAGGYTTLRALTTTDAFAAGISRYGVGDLGALARDTHKFESRYLDGLIGRYPEDAAVYEERSPVNHVDELSSPLLLLQGSDDAVVPPNQAEAMAAAVRAKGLPVALIIFAGEGHGFRRAETIQAAAEAELYFLGRVLGFTPADRLPEIPIDNLPPRR